MSAHLLLSPRAPIVPLGLAFCNLGSVTIYVPRPEPPRPRRPPVLPRRAVPVPPRHYYPVSPRELFEIFNRLILQNELGWSFPRHVRVRIMFYLY